MTAPGGAGLAVQRRPPSPGRPIAYTALDAPGTDRGAEVAAAGFEAGYETGQQQAALEAERAAQAAEARVEQALAALDRAAGMAAVAYGARCTELETAAPTLAFDLLETLLGREAALAGSPGRDAVARALALDTTDEPATVRLHPDDLDAVGDLADVAGGRTLALVADASVDPGGARVDIASTTIDAQLSTALGRVRAVLVPAAGETGPDGGSPR